MSESKNGLANPLVLGDAMPSRVPVPGKKALALTSLLALGVGLVVLLWSGTGDQSLSEVNSMAVIPATAGSKQLRPVMPARKWMSPSGPVAVQQQSSAAAAVAPRPRQGVVAAADGQNRAAIKKFFGFGTSSGGTDYDKKLAGDKALSDSLKKNFPGALPGPVVHEKLLEVLGRYGFTPENTILGTSVCSDEINTVQGTLVDTMKKYWGTNFQLGGIGGAPYVGKTGFGAFSAHVPDNGNVMVLYGPHVGVSSSGEVGKCLRPGQSKESTACGACIAGFSQNQAGGIEPDFDLDMQQSWLRAQLDPFTDRIKHADDPMAELAKVSFEAVEKKMHTVSNTNYGPGFLALVGGIQINMPLGYPDYFLPLSLTMEKAGDLGKADLTHLLTGKVGR